MFILNIRHMSEILAVFRISSEICSVCRKIAVCNYLPAYFF